MSKKKRDWIAEAAPKAPVDAKETDALVRRAAEAIAAAGGTLVKEPDADDLFAPLRGRSRQR